LAADLRPLIIDIGELLPAAVLYGKAGFQSTDQGGGKRRELTYGQRSG
jgi:hypothetical protein